MLLINTLPSTIFFNIYLAMLFMKSTLPATLLLSIMATLSTPVNADEQLTQKYYLAPVGSYLDLGGDSAGYGGWGTGLGIGRVINQHLNLEARGFWQSYNNKFSCCGGGETDLVGATLDLQYYFKRNKLSPYLVTSLGGMSTDIQSKYFHINQSSFIFEAGAGLTYSLINELSLRGDVRYRINTLPAELGDEGVLNDLVVNIGVQIPLNFK